jgi:hypothetical protein
VPEQCSRSCRLCHRTGRLTRLWTPAGLGTRTLPACCGPTSVAWASLPWAAPAPVLPARWVEVQPFKPDPTATLQQSLLHRALCFARQCAGNNMPCRSLFVWPHTWMHTLHTRGVMVCAI